MKNTAVVTFALPHLLLLLFATPVSHTRLYISLGLSFGLILATYAVYEFHSEASPPALVLLYALMELLLSAGLSILVWITTYPSQYYSVRLNDYTIAATLLFLCVMSGLAHLKYTQRRRNNQ